MGTVFSAEQNWESNKGCGTLSFLLHHAIFEIPLADYKEYGLLQRILELDKKALKVPRQLLKITEYRSSKLLQSCHPIKSVSRSYLTLYSMTSVSKNSTASTYYFDSLQVMNKCNRKLVFLWKFYVIFAQWRTVNDE